MQTRNLPDLEIAKKADILPITRIARDMGIDERELVPYGDYMGKVYPDILERLKDRPYGKYILVTAVTPTPFGEGKTVSTIGLGMALNRIGKKASVCIRQPSLAPVFGIKGGGAGGGFSQVVPMEDVNLHLTGDMYAVEAAHNLCAAFLNNSIFKGNKLNINPETITWARVLDVADRFLRNIVVGKGIANDKFRHKSFFEITSASEVMAALALASSLKDLRQRLAKIMVAFDYDGKMVTAEDINVAGAMAVLLKNAINPNLLQTIENTPCFVHTGPFGNIAHGNSSIIADKIGLKLSDYVVTEAGFGADLGAEKFFNIKCRTSGIKPDCVVMVCSIRALKVHSGKINPDNENIYKEDLELLEDGCCNLQKQIDNVKLFGMPVVVAINKFSTDTRAELDLVARKSAEFGADDVVVNQVYSKGSEGGVDLANSVVKLCQNKADFKFLYPLEMPIKEKIETIAKKIYGASEVLFEEKALEKIKVFAELNFDKLPVCMAKTHLSLSADPKKKGRPENFILPVRDVRVSCGAGFLYALCGKINTMPGLPMNPAGESIDIDDNGQIVGIF